MEKTVYIYELVSSRDFKNTRYIGKTSNPLSRVKEHIKEAKIKTTYKTNWINKERKEGYKIHINVIDIVWEDSWDFWEIFYIAEYKRRGYKLTNASPGGELAYNSEETLVLDLNNNIINKFNSIRQASAYYNVLENTVRDIIKGRRRYAKNYIFIKASNYNPLKDYSINKSKRPNKYKKVYQFNLKGEFIKEWYSSQEISNTLKIPKGVLSNVINNRQKSTRGYIFSLKRTGVSIPDVKMCKRMTAAYNI